MTIIIELQLHSLSRLHSIPVSKSESRIDITKKKISLVLHFVITRTRTFNYLITVITDKIKIKSI